MRGYSDEARTFSENELQQQDDHDQSDQEDNSDSSADEFKHFLLRALSWFGSLAVSASGPAMTEKQVRANMVPTFAHHTA